MADFEYEFQMVGMNRVLDDSIETVFLMAEAKHRAQLIANGISGQACGRELAKL